jgi:fructose/tagatose bisphosphate aldolase
VIPADALPEGWPQAITIHDITHARAALAAARETGKPVILLSAPAAAGSVGVAFFAALVRQARGEFPDVAAFAILDCDHAAGRALAALRGSFDGVVYRGGGESWERLHDIAEQANVRLLPTRPDSIDLLECSDAEEAARTWLGHRK